MFRKVKTALYMKKYGVCSPLQWMKKDFVFQSQYLTTSIFSLSYNFFLKSVLNLFIKFLLAVITLDFAT